MNTTSDTTKKKADELGEMQNTILGLLNKIIADYKAYPEFNTIKMGLSNSFKEINGIRLKVVVGDEPEQNGGTNGKAN